MAWDDSKKADLIKKYQDQNPTPQNSVEIVKKLAEELGESANGIRLILTQAGVYVKKDAPAASSSDDKKAGGKTTSAKGSKEDAHNELKAQITRIGGDVDEDIISKLTGKAATYLAEIFKKVN